MVKNYVIDTMIRSKLWRKNVAAIMEIFMWMKQSVSIRHLLRANHSHVIHAKAMQGTLVLVSGISR